MTAFNQAIKKFDKELKELQNAFKIIKEASTFKQERSNKISLYINKALAEASSAANSVSKTNPALAEKLQDIVSYEQERLRATIDLQDLELEFRCVLHHILIFTMWAPPSKCIEHRSITDKDHIGTKANLFPLIGLVVQREKLSLTKSVMKYKRH